MNSSTFPTDLHDRCKDDLAALATLPCLAHCRFEFRSAEELVIEVPGANVDHLTDCRGGFAPSSPVRRSTPGPAMFILGCFTRYSRPAVWLRRHPSGAPPPAGAVPLTTYTACDATNTPIWTTCQRPVLRGVAELLTQVLALVPTASPLAIDWARLWRMEPLQRSAAACKLLKYLPGAAAGAGAGAEAWAGAVVRDVQGLSSVLLCALPQVSPVFTPVRREELTAQEPAPTTTTTTTAAPVVVEQPASAAVVVTYNPPVTTPCTPYPTATLAPMYPPAPVVVDLSQAVPLVAPVNMQNDTGGIHVHARQRSRGSFRRKGRSVLSPPAAEAAAISSSMMMAEQPRSEEECMIYTSAFM